MVALYWVAVLLAGLACTSGERGTLTSVEKYPSIAQVEMHVDGLWMQYCAASVLTSLHVISTANCFSVVTFSENNRRIRAGTSYRSVGGVVVEVYIVYVHPDFSLLGNDADLAIVRLSSALPLGGTIEQIPILGEGIYLPYNLPVQLAAWGTTTGGEDADENLYELDLYTVTNIQCLETYMSYDSFPNNVITENMICTRLRDTEGHNYDPLDVGAPLFYSGTAVGVVSFGVADGDDSYPVVSTAIGSYTNWIIEMATQ